jgi:4-hydroxy-2-oxoheptanedioate aldolase
MRPSVIKAKLRRNEPVLLTSLALADPSLFELASVMGFDGIWLDLEHHSHSVETAATLMRAARVGTADVMLRCAKGEFMRMGRLLEAGANGIMYPRCDDAAEARELVAWSKFAPMGRRGLDSANGDNPYSMTPVPRYVREANEQTFLVVQIEDPAALDHVDAIASVEGVDVLFIGPADFSLLAGYPGQVDHPVVRDAIRRVASACERSGKAWGLPTPTPQRARELLEMGARFLAYGADILMVKNGREAIRHDFSPLGFRFGGVPTGG